MALSSTEQATLQVISSRLGVNPDDLTKLIRFESGWNPLAKNPRSSARGLIQFIDSTAQKLGYNSSSDLVAKNPTIQDQLPLVERYLSQYKPFANKQALYMSVLYPSARNWPSTRLLPEIVRTANPGINTPADYVRKIEGGKIVVTVGVPLIIIGSIAAYFIWKGQKRV